MTLNHKGPSDYPNNPKISKIVTLNFPTDQNAQPCNAKKVLKSLDTKPRLPAYLPKSRNSIHLKPLNPYFNPQTRNFRKP